MAWNKLKKTLYSSNKILSCRGRSGVGCGDVIHSNIYILIIQLMLQSEVNAAVDKLSGPIWAALHACSIWSDLNFCTALKKKILLGSTGTQRSRQYHTVRLVSSAVRHWVCAEAVVCLQQVNKHFNCSQLLPQQLYRLDWKVTCKSE